MLAQVTYIQKFIMADSEDEFMPICFAVSTTFVANKPKHLPADVVLASARHATPSIRGRLSHCLQLQNCLIPWFCSAMHCS